LPLVAQLAQFNLLLAFQVATRRSVLAVYFPALGQFIILAFVQCVDLVIQIDLKVFAGIVKFRLTR
jgi:hypothetical protein